jgi:hypothetical protein
MKVLTIVDIPCRASQLAADSDKSARCETDSGTNCSGMLSPASEGEHAASGSAR